MEDYKLSAQLVGHEADVRAVSFMTSDAVISASRDCTVRLWRRQSDNSKSFEGSIISRASAYVNSTAFIPSTKEFQDGLVASAGKDTLIEIRSPQSTVDSNAERLLVGHAHNVCTLDVSPVGSFLVSGGWDGQARVWDTETWETKQLLTGHNGMAVWSCVALDEHTVITGCADKCIRIFDLRKAIAGENTPIGSIQTPDVVRALCKVSKSHPSGADIISASNDGILRLWTLNGQQVGELHGHESFVYSLSSLPSGELVSSGEDRTVRIWKGSECVQTITHPAISVWVAVADPVTGDIVTGASDGVARVFTRRAEYVADQETLRLFQESVQSSSIPQQQLGVINKEKLPGPEFLSQKSGTKEGQVQMVKEDNGNVTAYQWSTSQQTWLSVGTVVDAVGSTGKKIDYNGKLYDFVFDVDIEDGKPPLKLPYNLSENPYESARKFLGDHELPVTYLDNVAQFIVGNTKGASLDQSTAHQKIDEMSTSTQANILPQTEYLKISAAKYEAMFNKISSVNQNMITAGNKDLALNPGEETILHVLQTAMETSGPIPTGSMHLITKIVTLWPYSDRLAGLDLLRCVSTYPTGAQFVDGSHGSVLDIALNSSFPLNSVPNESAVMMGVRVITNLFNTADGRSLLSSQAEKAITFLERITGTSTSGQIGKTNRNVSIAVATAAINFSVLINREKLISFEQRRRLLVVIGSILKDGDDSEVIYRALVAAGTILTTSREVAVDLHILSWMQSAKQAASEDRIGRVADECIKLLS